MELLLNGKQMQKADHYTIHEKGIASLTLMERAARACVDTIYQENLNTSCVLIVCGMGNNGGDGFAIGRMLLEDRKKVTALFIGSLDKRTEDCKIQMERYQKMGGEVIYDIPSKEEYTLYIDAIFGVGLSRKIEGVFQNTIHWMNQQQGDKFAVDIPSGVCSNSGTVLGCSFYADVTVTFQSEKIGMALYPGKEAVGKLIVSDIGIFSDEAVDVLETFVSYQKEEYREMLPSRKSDSHKGTYGKVLIVAGSKGMSGAAFFNAYAAYLSGAGLVMIYTHEDNRTILQQLLPEAIVRTYQSFQEEELFSLMNWADVLCVGSGLGKSQTSMKILSSIIEYNVKPCVLDADAINLIGENKNLIQKMDSHLYVFTPHMLEMSRLSDVPVSMWKNDRIGQMKKWMKINGAVYVLKDANTMIFQKDCPGVLNRSGNASMAKAGSGDVLAGIITGFMAQQKNPFDAAVLGVYIHGKAGEAASSKKGMYSVMATDLLGGIASAMKELSET